MRDADLKLIRKGSTVENNIKAVRILKDLDIDIWPMFMVRPEFDRQRLRGFTAILPGSGSPLYRLFRIDAAAGNRPL